MLIDVGAVVLCVQTVDSYRIVGTLTNEEIDAARRIQRLSRRALHVIIAKREKAARKIQVAASHRVLAKHKMRHKQVRVVRAAQTTLF